MAKHEKCPQTSHSNPVKAIRMKCVDCCGGMIREVEKCAIKNCALYPFRMGKNPFRESRELSEEEKQAMRERLAKARKAKKEVE